MWSRFALGTHDSDLVVMGENITGNRYICLRSSVWLERLPCKQKAGSSNLSGGLNKNDTKQNKGKDDTA